MIDRSGQGSNFCFLVTRHQQRNQSLALHSSCLLGALVPWERQQLQHRMCHPAHRKWVRASVDAATVVCDLTVCHADSREWLFPFCWLAVLLYTWNIEDILKHSFFNLLHIKPCIISFKYLGSAIRWLRKAKLRNWSLYVT